MTEYTIDLFDFMKAYKLCGWEPINWICRINRFQISKQIYSKHCRWKPILEDFQFGKNFFVQILLSSTDCTIKWIRKYQKKIHFRFSLISIFYFYSYVKIDTKIRGSSLTCIEINLIKWALTVSTLTDINKTHFTDHERCALCPFHHW